jgi:CubicO group peptidase (beta-lactamase class C family)
VKSFLRSFCLISALGCATAACGSDDEGATPGATLDFGPFEREVQAFVDEIDGVDGAGVVVVHRDKGIVYRKAFGAFAEDRAYLVASASKIVTVGVMMKLVDDGLIDIEKPISDYVTWAGKNGGLKLRQFFSNSSGLPGLLSGPDGAVYLTNYVCQFTPTGTLRECAEQVLTTDVGADAIPPDTEFRYGGAQWQAAGGVVEAVAGKPWSDLLRETFIEPCGLLQTGYTHPTWSQDLSYPTDLQGKAENAPASDNPNMEAGLFTNLDDYAKILSIHLNGGLCGWGSAAKRVLSTAAVEAMRVDRVAGYGQRAWLGFPGAETLEGYGMGWWIDRANPGIFVDEGAWGATPWIDLNRGYAAFIAIENNFTNGDIARRRTQPLLEAAFDAGGN